MASPQDLTPCPLLYRRKAPPPSTTDYSLIPQGNQQPQPASFNHPHVIANQETSFEQISRRHARFWDPIEITEAFQTFTIGGQTKRHSTTTQYLNFDSTPDQDSFNCTLDYNRPGPEFIRIEVTTPTPPVESVVFVSDSRSHPITSSALPQGTDVQNSASICLICLENTNDFPRHGPTSGCVHPPVICAPCLEQYISHAVLTDGLTSITCPTPECRQTFDYEDIVRGAGGDQTCLKRYRMLSLRRNPPNNPNFVWCKNPTCGWGQIHGAGAENPLVVCEECNAESCFTHDISWHTGLTCEEFNANTKLSAKSLRSKKKQDRKETRKSERYIRRNTKKCPSPSCGRRIQKNGGCDHMTCHLPAGCGHEFCWFCSADYPRIRLDGNHRHKFYCIHYRPHWPKRILRRY